MELLTKMAFLIVALACVFVGREIGYVQGFRNGECDAATQVGLAGDKLVLRTDLPQAKLVADVLRTVRDEYSLRCQDIHRGETLDGRSESK